MLCAVTDVEDDDGVVLDCEYDPEYVSATAMEQLSDFDREFVALGGNWTARCL